MLGHDLESFWQQTDRTLQLAFDASYERAIADYNTQLNIAWHHAAMMKAKKLPALSKLEVKRPNRRARHIPWQEKVEALKRWHVASGGKITKREDS